MIPRIAVVLILGLSGIETAAAQPQTLTFTRELKIDGVAEELVRVTWVRVAPDGRIAFSQFQDRLVRFYDANGKLIGKFGRAGDGPGEFRNLGQAGWFGDSLWVHDATKARLTVIPPSLGTARITETGIRAGTSGHNATLPRLLGIGVEGISPAREYIVSGMPFRDSAGPPLPAFSRDLQTAFVRYSARAIYESFLAGVQMVPGRLVSVGTAAAAVPFILRHPAGVAHNASRIVVVVPVLEGRDAGTFTATAVGIRGDTIYSRRHPFPLERIPPAEARKAVDDRVESLRKLGNANAESFRSLAKLPPAYPPFSLIFVGRDGSVWLGGRLTPGGRNWLVLDPRGEPYGRILLKDGVSIGEADLTNIWTVEPDADGVESVVRSRITRGG